MSVIEVSIDFGRAPGQFRVQVLDSPAGQGAAEVVLDVGALLAGRERFEKTLLLSGMPTRADLAAEEPIRGAGKSLFDALLGTGEVAGRYRAAVAVTDERGEQLRIVLRIGAPELAVLPWEAMYDTETGAYVCRQHQLVRHVPITAAAPPLTVQAPLRILGVVSAPHGLPDLDASAERDQLTRALADPIQNRLVELAWAPSAMWSELHDLLLAGSWHVIHFVGHGDFDPVRNEGVLYMTREDGSAAPVSASNFATLLHQAHPMPRLVVLNSCRGAATSTGDLFSGTAAALTRSGVAAVTAMQYSISDPAAIAFARGFYAALAQGRGVDAAVSAGRVRILGTSDQTLEWITPVLYLRGNNTRLFAVGRDEAPDKKAPDPPAVAPPAPESSEPASPAPPAPVVPAVHSGQPAKVRLRFTLKGHKGVVRQVVFSQDGRLAATVGADMIVRLWDIAEGRSSHVLNADFAAVYGVHAVPTVTFNPDGATLAVARKGTDLRMWNISTGAVGLFSAYMHRSEHIAFSPDGIMLAAADNTSVSLWEVSNRKRIHTLRHVSTVTYVAYSPDGTVLATSLANGAVVLWDPDTGQPIHTLAGLGSGSAMWRSPQTDCCSPLRARTERPGCGKPRPASAPIRWPSAAAPCSRWDSGRTAPRS